ncbi:MAG: hypothetical protein RLZZ126_1151 [Pseudomonadota bacterium]|jgi:uncharacterized protein
MQDIHAWVSAWLYPAGVVLLAYMVLGITGFGSALVAVPLLSWQWPLPEVVALVVSLDVVASSLHGGLNFRSVQWRNILQLLPGTLAGVLLALLMLRGLPPQWPLLALGLYVVWVGMRALLPAVQRPSQRSGRLGTGLTGVVVGIIELLFGTAGPPIVAWLTRQIQDVRLVRATAPVTMVFVSLIALAGMAAEGRMSTALHWQRFAVLLAIALLGVTVGHGLAGKLPDQGLRKLVCGMLVVSGLALVARSGAF